jgi:uncharacterized protein (TIGR00251 family)
MTRAAAAVPPWLSGSPGTWHLSIHAQPGASRTEVVGDHDGCLKIRLAAPPIEGRANDALRAWLSTQLGVPRGAVTIEHGDGSRRKRVRVDCDLTRAALAARLDPASYQGDAP